MLIEQSEADGLAHPRVETQQFMIFLLPPLFTWRMVHYLPLCRNPLRKRRSKKHLGCRLFLLIKKCNRFKMSGWIGSVPYFEDLQTKVSGSSSNNVRNRVEIKKPYKLNPNFKPGSSTLVQTTMEDEAKLLIVEYFAVQQIPNKKTGRIETSRKGVGKRFSNWWRCFPKLIVL